MLLVPALHSQENRVFLWSRSNVSSPVAILQGHKGAVVEAQWRKVAAGTQLCCLRMYVYTCTGAYLSCAGMKAHQFMETDHKFRFFSV